MKNLKITLQLFICSFIIVILFGSFNDDKTTTQDCSVGWVKEQNFSIRKSKSNPISSSVVQPFEKCVISLSTGGNKSE